VTIRGFRRCWNVPSFRRTGGGKRASGARRKGSAGPRPIAAAVAPAPEGRDKIAPFFQGTTSSSLRQLDRRFFGGQWKLPGEADEIKPAALAG